MTLTSGLLAHVLLGLAVVPVTSDLDVRTVDALSTKAALPRGTSEYLSTDLSGDGVPEVVLVRRARTGLTLFVVAGPVSRGSAWWRLDVPAGECLVPARTVLGLVDAGGVLARACGPSGHGDACELLARWRTVAGPAQMSAHPGLRLSGGRCAPVHVFFDGDALRSWRPDAPTP